MRLTHVHANLSWHYASAAMVAESADLEAERLCSLDCLILAVDIWWR